MKITITKKEYSQFYIYNYFYNNKRFIKFMRMYLGPIMTIVGAFLFMSYRAEVNVFFIGFLLAYGIFYTLKPMILVLAYKPKDETFSYKIADYNLYVKDRIKEGSFDLKKNKLVENKRYFVVKLDTGQNIFSE